MRAIVCVLIAMIAASQMAWAEKIQFDKSELATETVLPIFDDPTSIRNRNVSLTGRMEVGFGLGLSLIEALYQQTVFGGSITYNMDEVSGINILALSYSGGLSDSANQLSQGGDLGPGFQLQYAPAPSFVLLGNYQYTIFYGKMSVSKQSVMNLHLYSLFGGGVISFDGSMTPGLNVGLGQKFYFTPNLALRFDLNFIGYQGPNIVAKEDLDELTEPTPASEFPQTFMFSSYLVGGLVYLF